MSAPQKRFLHRIGLFIVLLIGSFNGISQQDAFIADTGEHGLFKNFVGIKLFAADFGATSINQDLQFRYVSNNPLGAVYHFQHDMDVRGINNFFNLGLGMEENLGKHLTLNFFNGSVGYIHSTWNWNIGTGAGYFFELNKTGSMRLNASVNVYYQYITYSFGDYYDTTRLGFFVDGVNVGTSIQNVKYVNDVFSIVPGVEFLYRRSNWDFYAGAYFNYVFYYHEKVNFYVHSIPPSMAIDYPNPNNGPLVPVSGNVINMNKYIIQIGIMREFGL